jgi:hypothetical protein
MRLLLKGQICLQVFQATIVFNVLLICSFRSYDKFKNVHYCDLPGHSI